MTPNIQTEAVTRDSNSRLQPTQKHKKTPPPADTPGERFHMKVGIPRMARLVALATHDSEDTSVVAGQHRSHGICQPGDEHLPLVELMAYLFHSVRYMRFFGKGRKPGVFAGREKNWCYDFEVEHP